MGARLPPGVCLDRLVQGVAVLVAGVAVVEAVVVEELLGPDRPAQAREQVLTRPPRC